MIEDSRKGEIINDKDSAAEISEEKASGVNETVATDASVLEEENVVLSSAKGEETTSVSRKKGFRYGCFCFFKRAFDMISSGLFLIIFSWLYLILAIAVKCSDGGTVFYRHERMGKNGKIIKIPKFRSMRKNADRLEDVLTPEQLEIYRREYKIENDPRITKLGKFLRKTSLDELPNIWSVFVGDISLIGPRPIMKSELTEKYGKDADKLLSVKPGMIGWWACNGRNNVTYDSGERQKLELYYVDHQSFGLDVKIIFKTIACVFKRTGAK